MRREKNKNATELLYISNLEHVENFEELIKYVKRVCKCDSYEEAETYLKDSVNPLNYQDSKKYFFKSSDKFIQNLQYDLRTKFKVLTYIVS